MAKTFKKHWIRIYLKVLFFSLSFPNKLIGYKRRVNCINNDPSAAVEIFWFFSSSQPVSSGYK